jgi:hypothetical protein
LDIEITEVREAKVFGKVLSRSKFNRTQILETGAEKEFLGFKS